MTETNTDMSTDVMSDYNNLGKVNIIDAAIAQDKDAFMQAFNDAISQKVVDALEVKKVEIASNLLGTQEVETNEIETTQAEVDGSRDGRVAQQRVCRAQHRRLRTRNGTGVLLGSPGLQCGPVDRLRHFRRGDLCPPVRLQLCGQ